MLAIFTNFVMEYNILGDGFYTTSYVTLKTCQFSLVTLSVIRYNTISHGVRPEIYSRKFST